MDELGLQQSFGVFSCITWPCSRLGSGGLGTAPEALMLLVMQHGPTSTGQPGSKADGVAGAGVARCCLGQLAPAPEAAGHLQGASCLDTGTQHPS